MIAQEIREIVWKALEEDHSSTALAIASDRLRELDLEEEADLLLWFRERKQAKREQRSVAWPLYTPAGKTFAGHWLWRIAFLQKKRKLVLSEPHHILPVIFNLMRGVDKSPWNLWQRSYLSLPQALQAYKNAVEQAEINYS